MVGMRGLRTGFPQLQKQLKGVYGRWAGELHVIENPPKSLKRAWRGRDAYEARAPERARRADEIREALPHLAYVIKMFDPDWRTEDAELVRPKAEVDPGPGPSVGWVSAAISVLREADRYLSIAEIVEEIADRWDYDDSSVTARQRGHTAVTKGLQSRVREGIVVRDDGEPARYALASCGLDPGLTSDVGACAP